MIILETHLNFLDRTYGSSLGAAIGSFVCGQTTQLVKNTANFGVPAGILSAMSALGAISALFWTHLPLNDREAERIHYSKLVTTSAILGVSGFLYHWIPIQTVLGISVSATAALCAHFTGRDFRDSLFGVVTGAGASECFSCFLPLVAHLSGSQWTADSEFRFYFPTVLLSSLAIEVLANLGKLIYLIEPITGVAELACFKKYS